MAKVGDKVGPWRLTKPLGAGGNGTVFEATNGDRFAALKLLKRERRNPKALARFQDEVSSLQRCQDIDGVIGLIDSHVPVVPTDADPPWLAMELATTISPERLSFREVVGAIRDVAHTLAKMHDRGISHRDLKPQNILFVGNRATLGDFGLSDFDGKNAETSETEKVGPIYYIAPEMLNTASTADGRRADVYSLAKTLWVLTTGQKYPLPGHHLRTQPALTISAYTSIPTAAGLDAILEHSTAFEPTDRPLMSVVAADLDAWLSPLVAPTVDSIDMSEFAHQLTGH